MADKKSVVTEADAKKLSSFGTFTNEEVKREQESRAVVTSLDKAMINHGLVKLFNTKVKTKKDQLAETINHERFLQICEAFNVDDKVKLAYTNRKAGFTSQSDDLILFFKKLKPNNIGDISYKEKKMIICESIENIKYKYFDEAVDLVPSNIRVGDLTLLAPINSIELGLNPKIDRLSGMDNLVIDYLFDAIAKKSAE